MKQILSSLDDTKKLAKKIAKLLRKGDVIFFEGDLGVGKTTLINLICNEFNLEAKSPTFSLVNLYKGDVTISHIDLYRLESYEDAINIGIEDILDDDTIKFIEWPEILGTEPYDLLISIRYESNKRVLTMDGPLLKRGEIDG